jgi:hypothetical protein
LRRYLILYPNSLSEAQFLVSLFLYVFSFFGRLAYDKPCHLCPTSPRGG